jgi:hypothetical protein
VGPQKLPKEPFLRLLTALAWTAPLLLTGCQEDRRTSKEEIRHKPRRRPNQKSPELSPDSRNSVARCRSTSSSLVGQS